MPRTTFQIARIVTILLVFLAITLACATTTPTSELNVETQVALTLEAIQNDGETPAEVPCNSVGFNGISFCLDSSIAQGISTTVVPATSNSDAPWYDAPQTEQIDFTGYITGEKFHDPRIIIYPVTEYIALGNRAAEEIATLQQYLANKPNIPAGSIPFLPLWNAAQLFNTLPAFVTFQNGQGIRFLAEYGQYSAPVNNTDLFYTFQGITDDGAYYISIILPVTHPSLPADFNVDAALQDTILADYDAYLAGVLGPLSAQPLNSFVPDIELLDTMIQSFRVH